RQCRERGKALVPQAPRGPGFERLAGSLVVGCSPGGDLFGITVFEPPIGIGDFYTVQHLDVGALPSRWCRTNRWLSHVPCWDACRGSPSIGASARSEEHTSELQSLAYT